ncbi:MAG TPA: transcriptional regulator, partial [Ruminococcaceae bacterium]|nr:transcriptional regulator [Oscillospiraceae bacterium]
MFLALFTLSGEDGAPPKNSETARIASEKLKSAMISSLRRSDVATSYSAFQFIALLPAATYEDAQ